MTPEKYEKWSREQERAWDQAARRGEYPPLQKPAPVWRTWWRALVEWLRDDPERREI